MLAALGLGIFFYKAFVLNLALTPDHESQVWLVEAKLGFKADGRPVKAEMYIPQSSDSFLVMDENFVSRGYGLTTKRQDENRKAVWSIRSEEGWQTLYYRAVIRKNQTARNGKKVKKPAVFEFLLPEVEQEAVGGIIEKIKEMSADEESFIHNAFELLKLPRSDKNVLLLAGSRPTNERRVEVLLKILKKAGFAARSVQGIDLGDFVGHADIKHRIEVYSKEKKKWISYNIDTGSSRVPSGFLPWWFGEQGLTEVKGGENVIVNIGIERSQENLVKSALKNNQEASSLFLDFSLLHLPLDIQAVYRVLLLIPLGALLVVILRNVVGVKTFGTFMPVLIALAFRETELLWGIFLFTLLLSGGLMVRFYLEHLKLLLVPRLAAIVTVVVIMMVFFSIMTQKLGLDRGLSVALFPMIVLAMTIERMSIVWDELGPGDAMKQGIGTMLVASAIFLLIFHELFEHLLFVFPELLFVILAFTLLLGRYTGYRVVELYRFREFVNK